jgi:hypothetical protein
MYKQWFVLVVLALLALSSGCMILSSSDRSPIQPTPGSLEISTTPQGAEIYLNGVYRGTAPATISDLKDGSYYIELRFREYTPWTKYVDIQAGTKSSIDVTLAPLVVPTTTIPTPIPTPVPTIPPKTVVGCWELDPHKGNGTIIVRLELESGGTGRFSEGPYSVNIHWSQDPTTKVVYVSYVKPGNPTEFEHMDFDYDETSDTVTWRDSPSAPFTRVAC